ncbi:MAG: transposase, partial [Oscillospiraceae bacterium]|nr:transposase [Oscillospiraceae bacterium]
MRKGQRKRVWTKEQKLEIVHKHLDEHISIKKLGKEYGIIHGMVSRWTKEYLAEGEAA